MTTVLVLSELSFPGSSSIILSGNVTAILIIRRRLFKYMCMRPTNTLITKAQIPGIYLHWIRLTSPLSAIIFAVSFLPLHHVILLSSMCASMNDVQLPPIWPCDTSQRCPVDPQIQQLHGDQTRGASDQTRRVGTCSCMPPPQTGLTVFSFSRGATPMAL